MEHRHRFMLTVDCYVARLLDITTPLGGISSAFLSLAKAARENTPALYPRVSFSPLEFICLTLVHESLNNYDSREISKKMDYYINGRLSCYPQMSKEQLV